ADAEVCGTADQLADQGARNAAASRCWNDVDAAEPRREFRARFHVAFSERSGANGFLPIVQRDHGHWDSIGVHSCPDVIQPAGDGSTGIKMAPLCEVPLRNDRCQAWAI